MATESKTIPLSEIARHDRDEVESILVPKDQYSVFEDYDDFLVLVIRHLQLIPNEGIGFTSNAFLIRDSIVYSYQRESGNLKSVSGGVENLLRSLEGYYIRNQRIIDGYAKEVEGLEDTLFNRRIPSYFLDMWFDLKKDLSKIENFYYRNSIVYREFFKKSEKLIGDLVDEFNDIGEGIEFQATAVKALSSRLESLHHYYESIKGDRLNKTLLMLTIISGVFLPLNLIVGFFGMNTSGMFLQTDPKASETVVIILVCVFITCALGLRVIKAIDHYILKFLLGRYNFYKNITKRLSEIEERLKGN